MTKAGDGILAGALDALAYIEGDESRGRAHKIINAKIDVKAIRKKIGLSQVKFADTYGLPLSTLKKMGNQCHRTQRPNQSLPTGHRTKAECGERCTGERHLEFNSSKGEFQSIYRLDWRRR